MYVFYIFVVLFGRFINQKIKVARGISITKNDFSSEKPTSSRINESDLNDCEIQPLLVNQNSLKKTVKFSVGSSLKEAFCLYDANEWKKSNIFFKFMIIAKVSSLFKLIWLKMGYLI